jgi:hypothetical protein
MNRDADEDREPPLGTLVVDRADQGFGGPSLADLR